MKNEIKDENLQQTEIERGISYQEWKKFKNKQESLEEKYLKIVNDNINKIRESCSDSLNRKSLLENYRDPDEKFPVYGPYRLAPDGICGIKYMTDCFESAQKQLGIPLDLADIYGILRKLIILWPRHRQSINQRRYSKYRDRFDLTLYDIKLAFEDTSQSYLVKEDTKSQEWLKKFDSFSDFCDKMGYSRFVDKGEVYNLSLNSKDHEDTFITSENIGCQWNNDATYLCKLLQTLYGLPK